MDVRETFEFPSFGRSAANPPFRARGLEETRLHGRERLGLPSRGRCLSRAALASAALSLMLSCAPGFALWAQVAEGALESRADPETSGGEPPHEGKPPAAEAPAREEPAAAEAPAQAPKEPGPTPGPEIARPEERPGSWGRKPTRIDLSLEDAIRMAIENNLNVKISKIDEGVREREVEAARGIFDPSLNLGTTYAKNREPTASILYVPGVTTIGLNKFETLSYYGSISGTHLLGTRYELRVSQSERDNPTVNKTFTLLNPIAQTQVIASLRQPLLKGAWYTVNTADVRIAENTARLAREQLELAVIDTVFRVEEAYWNLLFATKNLEAKEKTLEVTLANLENVRRKRQVGTLAAIDVTTAESQVALRRAELEEAKLLAENARDELLNLVNYTGDRSLKELWEDGTRRLPFDEIQLNPTTPPEFVWPPVDRHEALSLAFSKRPEYRQLDLNLLNDEIRLSVAKNALLPSLDVIGQWTQSGLQDSFGDSWDELGTGRYYSWFAGVEFSIPIPNRGPRSAYQNARDAIRRTRLQRMDLENRIVLEVDAAIRTIASLRRKVAELEERVRLQSELLQAERVKLEAGKSIPYTVSVIENDLVADQTNALRANADLQRAIAEFYRATGTLLERHRIQVVSD